jgi:hypothetical protein
MGDNARRQRQHLVTLGGQRGTSAAQQLHESMEKVRVARIWERRAQRVVLIGKGRTAALWHNFVKERVAPEPEGGGGRRRRRREGVCSGMDERARTGGGVSGAPPFL